MSTEHLENYVALLENWTEYKDENGKDLYDNLLDFYVKNYNRDYQNDLYVYVKRDENGVLSFSTETFENVGGNSYIDDDHFTLFSVGGTEHMTIADEAGGADVFVNCFRNEFPDTTVPTVNENGYDMTDDEQVSYIFDAYPVQAYALEEEILRDSDAVREFLVGIIDNEIENTNRRIIEIQEQEEAEKVYNEFYEYRNGEKKAFIVELDDKGNYSRFALTEEDFRKEYPETDIERMRKGDTDTLRPMVHIWAMETTVLSDEWYSFFGDMTKDLPQSDIDNDNKAYVDYSRCSEILTFFVQEAEGDSVIHIFKKDGKLYPVPVYEEDIDLTEQTEERGR